jgi:hypothetical protein
MADTTARRRRAGTGRGVGDAPHPAGARPAGPRGCSTPAPGATSAWSPCWCCWRRGRATAETFLTTSNLLTILTSASIIGVLTVGMTFVIIGGGIDLSVGKVMALASVWATTVRRSPTGRW